MGSFGSTVSGNGHMPKPTRPDAIEVSSKVAAEVSPGEIVLVKQQGAMRTGTNVVKFALDENFTNVRVLVNSYLELWSNERCCMLFRLEDLHTEFDVTLERSRQRWVLQQRHQRYISPERYLRAGIDGQSRSQLLESSLFDRKSQHADAHPGELYGSVLDLVRNTVDEDVVRAYGYEVR